MPSPEQILSSLHDIANQWQQLAVFWHLYFGALAIGMILGWRPSKRLFGIVLGVPLLSVSILAWMFANPFNGVVFGVVGVAQILLAARLRNEPVQIAPTWAVIAGVLMFLFGWLYPHFLGTASWVPYLYAAPTGLIPCPTLSIIIGLALLVEGIDSRGWPALLGATGIFYGLFGVVRLGVTIDMVLLLGALLLIMLNVVTRPEPRRGALAH